MSVRIDYSILGRLARLLFQPPKLSVTMQLEDGSQDTYRAVPAIAEEGVLVNRFVDSTDGAKVFFLHDGDLNPRVKRISFDSSNHWGFVDRVSYQIERLRLQ